MLLPKESNNNEPNEEVIRKTPTFIDMMAKLRTSERLTAEHKKEAVKLREHWAAAKGDLDLAKKTLADMEGKHERRWVELISLYSKPESTPKGEANVDGKDLFTNAKKNAELEIKLQQALESVSRMETVRATLNDALKMNEQLQSKLEDLKSKNAKMVAEKAATRASNKEADSLKSSPELLKKQSSGSGDPTTEKLQRDVRKLRKEVVAANLSKDQAKLKQEVSTTVCCIVCGKCNFLSYSPI